MESNNYFIVNYKGDGDKKFNVVPKNWVLEVGDDFPFFSYTYYNPETIHIQFLPESFLLQMKSDDTTQKQKGLAYKAKIIEGFGE